MKRFTLHTLCLICIISSLQSTKAQIGQFLVPNGSPMIADNFKSYDYSSRYYNSGMSTIEMPPSITITASPSDTICAGNNVSLTASGATAYTWAPVLKIVGSDTGASVLADPKTTTTYTVTGTIGVTKIKQTITIIVNPTPTLNVSSTTACLGHRDTLIASGSPAHYQWVFRPCPFCGLGSQFGDTIFAAIVTGYSVTAVSPAGCFTTKVITPSFLPLPTVLISFKDSICIGDSTTLKATGATSYVWNTGATTSSIKVSPSTTTTYTVLGTNAKGCSNYAYATLTIIPTPTVTVTPPASTICSGTSIPLVASGALKYKWSPATGLDTIYGDSVIASPIVVTTYLVTATTGNCKAKDKVKILVNPSPTVTISAMKDSANTYTLTANGATNYLWSNNQTSSSIVVAPNIYTLFSVIGTIANGCSSIAFDTIKPAPQSAVSNTLLGLPCGTSAESVAAISNKAKTDNTKVLWTDTIYHCGHWAIYYDDIKFKTKKGFDDPSLGAIRRATLCAALEYVQDTALDFSGIPANDPITLHVDTSITAYPYAPYFAVAGPIFEFRTPGTGKPAWDSAGIYDGNVFDHYINGKSPDTSQFDGVLTVNFSNVVKSASSGTFAFVYNNDYNTPLPGCEYDLYSILIHEITHTLGFISLITEDPVTFYPISKSASDSSFSLYDWDFVNRSKSFMSFKNPTPNFDKLVTGTIIKPSINPVLASKANAIQDGQLWLYDTNQFGGPKKSNPNQPLYSFYAPFIAYAYFVTATSLVSHLDDGYFTYTYRAAVSPGNLPNYVMSPFMYQSQGKRRYTMAELRALLNLKTATGKGYKINPANPNIAIVNNHTPYTTKQCTYGYPPFNDTTYTYPDNLYKGGQIIDTTIVNNGTPVVFDLSKDKTIYDPDGDAVIVEAGTLYNIRGCGTGNNNSQLKLLTNSQIQFTPRKDFVGLAQFGFYLNDGKERGSFMVYTINVLPGKSFINQPNPNTPPGDTELVLNGDYEQGTYVRLYPSNQFAPNTNIIYDNFEGSFYGGDNIADEHPLDWLSSSDWSSCNGVIIDSSSKLCGGFPTDFLGSFSGLAWSAPNVFNPLPKGTSLRYHELNGNFNYCSLEAPFPGIYPLKNCHPYILTFDINFQKSGLPIASNYNMEFGFCSKVTFPSVPAYNFSIPLTVPVDTASHWKTISVLFWYCGNPSTIMNIQAFTSTSSVLNNVFIDDVSLVQNPHPPLMTVSVTPTPATVCLGDTIPLTATVKNGGCNLSYLWQPGSLTTQTINVHPTSTTVYTVTVTDGCGILPPATATDTVTIDSTCCTGKGITQITNGKSSSYAIFKGFGAKNPLAISGTFTVNSNFSIANCNVVQMASNAIIDIKAPNTLTIDSSRLYACNNMWHGIIVEPGASIIINNKSIIEDAVTGVEGQNSSLASSKITIDSSRLNNNYEDIHIDPYFNTTVAYPLTLHHDSLTTGKDGIYSPNSYLKPPYSLGTITFTGVYLDSVQGSGVTIGDYSSAAYKNTFNNMQFGVQGFNSNFYVYNNLFAGLLGRPLSPCIICPPPPPPYGIAIVANATSFARYTPATYFTLIVGGNGPFQPNTFNTCYRGVDVTNYVNTKVFNNTFYNKTNFTSIFSAPVGDHAIYVKIEHATEVILDSNSITNFATGIHLNRTKVDTTILRHEDINSNNLQIAGTGFMIDGILAENATYTYFSPLNINNNIVDDATTCIWIRNLFEAMTNIEGNSDIRILKSTAAKSLTEKSGIRVDHCTETVNVINNPKIYTNGTYLRKPPTVPADTDVIGINVNLSTGVLVQCNTIYNVGQCMRFAQNCNGARIYSNTLTTLGTKCYDGIVLWNNAIIGSQGYTGLPIGDVWTDTASFLNSMTYTFNTKNPGFLSPLWLDSVPSYYPPKDFNKTNGLRGVDDYNEKSPKALNLPTSGTAPACPAPCPSCKSPVNSVLNSMATDSVPLAVFQSQTDYINQQYVLSSITRDTSLMTGDTVLQNFYSSNVSTTMGGINAVQQQMLQGNYNMAQIINNSLSPSITIEQNHQIVDGIFLNTLAIGNNSIDSAQLIELQVIAHECPYLGGQAVYEARSLVNLFLNTDIQYSDSCGSMPSDRPTKTIKNTYLPYVNAEVYPNPANTLVNIQTIIPKGLSGRVTFYSMLGETIMTRDLKNNLTICDVSQLRNGMYFYKIEITNEIAAVGKLVITR